MPPYPRGEERMDLPQLNKKATRENISNDTTNNKPPDGYEAVFGPLNAATDANVFKKVSRVEPQHISRVGAHPFT